MRHSIKKCSKCGIEKPVDQFSKSPRYRDGLISACKECRNAKSRAWTTANKSKVLEKAKEYREAHREQYRGYHAARKARFPDEVRIRRERRLADNPKYEWAKAAVARARTRAAKCDVAHSITIDDILPLCVDYCPALGTEMKYSAVTGTSGGRVDSPSLDRLIPNDGYVLGNIAVISWTANCIKTSADATQIRAVADWLEKIA